MRHRPVLSALFALTLLVGPHGLSHASTVPPVRILSDSVKLPDANGLTMGSARIVRNTLTSDELSAQMPFSVTLSMRDFAGLQARLATGARIPRVEMEAKYLPLKADYDRISAWLRGLGFKTTQVDGLHMTVFAEGTVSQIASAFGLSFSRVQVPDGEYTSAISAPSVPADEGSVVLGIMGLQPQFAPRHVGAQILQPRDIYGKAVYITPDNLVSAYNIPKSATGSGQIIAIVDVAPVLASDLTTFWSAVGVSQVATNVATINVDTPISSPTSSETDESNLDVEWAGALAPEAGIRLYLSSTNIFNCFSQIANDLASYPTMSVLSVSYSAVESENSASTLQSFSQLTSYMASQGMTIVAASGDSGSNPGSGSSGFGQYSASNPVAVSYPASDPYVTGVGGTAVEFTGTWNYAGELVWDQLASQESGTGGGISSVFSIPAWQTGGSVLAAQTMRCVPDVAAMSVADLSSVNIGAGYLPNTASDVGVLAISNGTATSYEGTSLATPIWAAVIAMVNQARASAGRGSVGLLNPLIYPLVSSGSFFDITSGTNGAYDAGPGYDLCTGLGSPNVANLISALSTNSGTPPASRLIDISTRAQVGTGADILIAGIYVNGPPGTTKTLVVRGIGPALGLAPFNISGALAESVVGVYDTNSLLIASNSGWANAPVSGTSPVTASFRSATAADFGQVGAFPLTAGSLDSAMVITLPLGSYTVELTGQSSLTGIGLVEVYELNTGAPQTLINLSSRCYVGSSAASTAYPGFVIQGTEPMLVLVRGLGPALIPSPFLISSAVPNPVITIYDSNDLVVASNKGWGNNPTAGTSPIATTFRKATSADFTATGAFPLVSGSKDSAIVIALPPGNYTAQVTDANGATGPALAEVYEIVGP